LCSHDENFKFLNRPDPGNFAIALANPQTIEFQVVRTSLLPGLLKTVRENRALPLPMKVFEVSDVAVQDKTLERQARNHRRMCGVYMDRKAGFEVVHGLLDRVMQVLGVPFLQSAESNGEYGYYISQADDPTYLPGRGAKIYLRPKPTESPKSDGPLHTLADNLKAALPTTTSHSRDIVLGSLGILHPSVLANFELSRPCSTVEIDIEPML